ncbi:hypothetical protein H0H92_014770 [Tricholoma furcatifolium]|nr:hypothetical protein H0H92_014770 [Tricholoma furcatifolium]
MRQPLTSHALDYPLSALLRQRYDHLISLKDRWTNSLASPLRFEAAIASAEKHAFSAAPQPVASPLQTFSGPHVDSNPNPPLLALEDDFEDDDDIDGVHFTSDAPDESTPAELVDLYQDVHFCDSLDDETTELDPISTGHPSFRLNVVWALPPLHAKLKASRNRFSITLACSRTWSRFPEQ